MIKSLRSAAMLTVLALGLAGTQAQAAFSGSIGLAIISPSINTSTLGTATTFTLGTIIANGNTTGGFTGTGGTLGSNASFTLGTSSGFTFTGTAGTFSQTALPTIVSMTTLGGSLYETFLLTGTVTGGPVGAATPASVTLTFSQSSSGGSIGAGGTLEIPPATVPEPASVALMGLGFVAVAGLAARRRLAK